MLETMGAQLCMFKWLICISSWGKIWNFMKIGGHEQVGNCMKTSSQQEEYPETEALRCLLLLMQNSLLLHLTNSYIQSVVHCKASFSSYASRRSCLLSHSDVSHLHFFLLFNFPSVWVNLTNEKQWNRQHIIWLHIFSWTFARSTQH